MLAESNSLPDLGPGYMNPKLPLSNAYRNYGLALAIPPFWHEKKKITEDQPAVIVCMCMGKVSVYAQFLGGAAG